MASIYCQAAFYPTKSSYSRDGHDPDKPKLNIKINGTPATSAAKVNGVNQSTAGATATLFATEGFVTKNGCSIEVQSRQNIPTEKQSVDPYRQGSMVAGVVYRQRVVIRSYEIGADKTATLESILNFLQETALNHVWMSGLLGDGFGATHGMIRNDLIWVVSRMQVEVDNYPIWTIEAIIIYTKSDGYNTHQMVLCACVHYHCNFLKGLRLRGEIVDIDTWVGASGKNGMRRDWLIRSHINGHIFARATSTWVMMNRKSRRLSKMPEEVRAEISPWFLEKYAIQDDVHEKIIKLNDKAKYTNFNLKPKRSDLDMNQHVNNVKYVKWMLETIPDQFLEGHQLSNIILEYRRECGSSDIVQSLSEPDEDGILEDRAQVDDDINLLGGFSLASKILDDHGFLGSINMRQSRYTHLLQVTGEHTNEEIVRGRTTWKRKVSTMPFST